MRQQQIVRDAVYGFRTLRQSPGFTLIAILILALGIGANTAIFTAVYHVLLQPLPYSDASRLVALWEDFSFAGFPRNNLSAADFTDWKTQNTVFEDIAVHRYRPANLTGGGAPEAVVGRSVTSNLFGLLGVAPMLGRTFTATEDRLGVPVVVLSYSLWQNRFGADRNLVGRSILIDGVQVNVIGVMPKSFIFPNRATSFWRPINFASKDLANRGSHSLDAVARLKSGVSVAQARVEMKSIAKRLELAYPGSNSRVGAVVIPLQENQVGDTRLPLLVLIAASGLVLLIAASNLANLLLARSSGRNREMAIRLALGAGPGRLIRQMIIEALLLSCAGGMFGLLVAGWSLGALEKLVPVSLTPALELDGAALFFTAGIALLTGVLFGLAPAWQSSSVPLNTVLKQAGGRAGVSKRTKRLRDALVISEVALAVILLVAAGLMLRTLGQLGRENPGFDPDHLLTMMTVLPRPKYDSGPPAQAYYDSVVERVRTLPGVISAGFASDLPFTSIGDTIGFRVEGLQTPSNQVDFDALYRETTTGYLQTIGARLLAGRFFNDHDRSGSQRVVIINETFARTFWPHKSAIGKRIQLSGETMWATVSGVVAEVRERGLLLGTKPAVYLPAHQLTRPDADYLAVRTIGDPLTLASGVRRAIWSVDPEQPVSEVQTMRDLMQGEISSRHEAMLLLSIFAALALLLASLGIYGVLAYAVVQRTQEMGIRLALGAERNEVIGMVVGQGMKVAAIGVIIGVAGALALTRTLAGLLYGVSPSDPFTFASVSLFLLLVSAFACYLPARRAAGVDPLVALRYE